MSIFKRKIVLSLKDKNSDCSNDVSRLKVPTELSKLTDVPSQVYKNVGLYGRVFSNETLQQNDKFGVISYHHIKKILRLMRVKKSEYKYTCLNTYKIKTLRLLTNEFSEHFFGVHNKDLRISKFVNYVVTSALMKDDLSSKIDVLKRGLSILEVYGIMKYLRVNCIIFDRTTAIEYKLNDFSEKLIAFRFNNSLDLDYCGTYDNIYKMTNTLC